MCGMGRVIFDTATTLNGYLADDRNSLDWLFAVPDPDGAAATLTPTQVGAYVEGSTTYSWVLEHEGLLESPERWADLYGDTPTFVFTTRSLPVPPGADVRFVSGSVADAFVQIRAAAGDGDIWVVGGGDLAGQCIDADLLDQIRLSVAPVALTSGAPLLPRTIGADRLRLVSADAVGQFARLIYDVRR